MAEMSERALVVVTVLTSVNAHTCRLILGKFAALMLASYVLRLSREHYDWFISAILCNTALCSHSALWMFAIPAFYEFKPCIYSSALHLSCTLFTACKSGIFSNTVLSMHVMVVGIRLVLLPLHSFVSLHSHFM